MHIASADRKLVASLAALVALCFGFQAHAQFASPTCVPPNCNPAVIQNISLNGTTQNAGINISGNAKIGATFLVGTASPVLNLATDNLIYGNVGNASINGSLLLLQFNATDRLRVSLAGQLQLPVGTPVAPSYTFLGDTNTGIYHSAADVINFATGGVSRLQIDAAGAVTIPGTLAVAGAFSAASFTGVGTGLTALNASNIASGTLADARLSTNVPLLNGAQTFTGANTFSNAGNSFTGNGAGMTALNGTNVTSGTVADARLSANIPLKNAANTFTGNNTLSGMSTLGGNGLVLAAGQNVLYGLAAASSTGGNLLLLQKGAGNNVFSVDLNGNLISAGTGAFTGNLTVAGKSVCRSDGTNCPPPPGVSGTTNFVSKFTGTGTTIGNSTIQDDGTNVRIWNEPTQIDGAVGAAGQPPSPGNVGLLAGTTSIPIGIEGIGSTYGVEGAGTTYGVFGSASTLGGAGVYGQASGSGVYGLGTNSNSAGVSGTSLHYGVSGVSSGTGITDYGVVGSIPGGGTASGVAGFGGTSSGNGVYGVANGIGAGVYGFASNAGGKGGVFAGTGAGTALVASGGAVGLNVTGSTNSITASGNITVSAGHLLTPSWSAATPAYSFFSDPDTGMFNNTANQLSFAAGGLEYMRILGDATQEVDILNVPLRLGVLAADPAGSNSGRLYVNSATGKIRCYELGAWKDCIPAAGSGIGGSGTIGAIPKFTPNGTTLGNSLLSDTGTAVSDSGDLNVTGSATLGTAGVTKVTLNAAAVTIPNNLDIDAGTLYVDAANNRVGVNTLTPAGALHVVSNWSGSYGALTLQGDRPTIRLDSSYGPSSNQKWLIHVGSAPSGGLSFFTGTDGTNWGNALVSILPGGTMTAGPVGTSTGSQIEVTPTGGFWNEGIAINPSTSSGYNALILHDAAGSLTNEWFIGRQPGDTLSFIRNGLVGMAGTSRADVPFEITSAGKISMGGHVGIVTAPTARALEVGGESRFSRGNMYVEPVAYGDSGEYECCGDRGLFVKGNSSMIQGIDGSNVNLLTLDQRGGASNVTFMAFFRYNAYYGGVVMSGGGVDYQGFHGSHMASLTGQVDEGMLVTMTGDDRKSQGTSEPIYDVAQAVGKNRQDILGVYTGTNVETKIADVTAVGNGLMWVLDDGRGIAPGDDLISADLSGYALKDDGTSPVSHVIAKAAERVDWNAVHDTIGRRKRKLISVIFTSYDKPNIGLAITDLRAEILVKEDAQDARIEALEKEVRDLKARLDAR